MQAFRLASLAFYNLQSASPIILTDQILTMNLTKIDLNLFHIFDIIYTEQNLTRAGQILGITQPAVSNALARLREAFNDTLFTRTAQGMMPTPVAQNVIPSVRSALLLLRNSVQEGHYFDPLTSSKRYKISVPDIEECTLLPSLMSLLNKHAPNTSLKTSHHRQAELINDLTTGALDFAINGPCTVPPNVRQLKTKEEDRVCVAQMGHSTIRGSLSLKQYADAQHIAIGDSSNSTSFLDVELARLGIKRDIVIETHTHFSAPPLVLITDYLLTVPRSLGESFQSHLGMQVFDLPIEVPPIQSFLYWHENAENDPANKWMREIIIKIMKGDDVNSEGIQRLITKDIKSEALEPSF